MQGILRGDPTSQAMMRFGSCPPIATDQARLPHHVGDFYQSRQGAFGALNLLDAHLPPPNQERAVVKNVVTLDYAIGRALGMKEYTDWVSQFASRCASQCGLTGGGASNTEYLQHIGVLQALGGAELAAWTAAAARNAITAVNLFSPKQCTLACRGCYTNSVPISKQPFTAETVASYYERAVRIVAQAKAMGASVVYTAGDGEMLAYPRFFDLLEAIAAAGMQWLLFTAGLQLSSEENASSAWKQARKHLRSAAAERLSRDIRLEHIAGSRKPTVAAFLREIQRHRDTLQVYHSIWSTDAATNTKLRHPLMDDYDYVAQSISGRTLYLPSSITDLMRTVFTGPHRGRLGIEMPVSVHSAANVVDVAAFCIENGLKTYFEPVILTGRNSSEALRPPAGEVLDFLAPLLVRSMCSFRNIHQPTVKSRPESEGIAFYTTPGMGIDLATLEKASVLEDLRIQNHDQALFRAVHSGLMSYASFNYSTGCKCNDFAHRVRINREAVFEEWQRASNVSSGRAFALDDILRLLSGAGSEAPNAA